MHGRVRWRPVNITITIKLNWEVFFDEFKELGNNIKLRLGCLRAVAQGYKYNYNSIELESNFQMNLRRSGITLSWGLDGCAPWRKITITDALKVIFKAIYKVTEIQLSWGLDAARGRARLQLQLRCTKILEYCLQGFKYFGNEIELGLGWLCAVAHDYNYSCNKIELGFKF